MAKTTAEQKNAAALEQTRVARGEAQLSDQDETLYSNPSTGMQGQPEYDASALVKAATGEPDPDAVTTHQVLTEDPNDRASSVLVNVVDDPDAPTQGVPSVDVDPTEGTKVALEAEAERQAKQDEIDAAFESSRPNPEQGHDPTAPSFVPPAEEDRVSDELTPDELVEHSQADVPQPEDPNNTTVQPGDTQSTSQPGPINLEPGDQVTVSATEPKDVTEELTNGNAPSDVQPT